MSAEQICSRCRYLVQVLLKICSYFYTWSTAWRRNLINGISQRNLKNGQKCSLQKESFLEEYGEEYGYPNGTNSVDGLRSREFSRLQGTVYLDHAGTTLYSENQLKSVLSDFSAQVYGNPHSQSDSSVLSSSIVEDARAQVLAFCNASAEEYSCVFTSGATAALKLVGETFPWTSDSQYMYTMENHNSVLGIREYALDSGATVTPVDIEFSAPEMRGETGAAKRDSFTVRKRSSQRRKAPLVSSSEFSHGQPVYSLFAFPQECNFSGVRFDLGLIPHVQHGSHTESQREKWLVLLDAAKGCSTSPPDLHRFPADFVAISFYKIFGYPTGLGALLVRKGASELMRKKYFGGGTVAVSIADADFVRRRRKVEEWLEDGTASFLSIAALHHGFDIVNRLGMAAIRRHTGSLTSYTASKLAALRHKNGRLVCMLYGNHNCLKKQAEVYWDARSGQGPVIAFNLRRADGSWVGYREVENLASLKGIHLRTGCFCNPGACAKYLGISTEDMKENFEAGRVCWDDNDIINGRPVGAVRVSFGYMSTFEDCWVFLNFISAFFVESQTKTPATASASSLAAEPSGGPPVSLHSISVYPVKSCSGFTATSWPLGDCGLLYDREWLIKSTSGEVLTQKKCPRMWSIKTRIDLEKGWLHVESPNMKDGLDIPLTNMAVGESSGNVPLCANPAGASTCGPDASRWFSQALGISCNLIRRQAKSRFSRRRGPVFSVGVTGMTEEGEKELSFANEGQFLLVSQDSVDDLNLRLNAALSSLDSGQEGTARSNKLQFKVDVDRFRPNLVVVGSKAYGEDEWEMLAIGDEQFKVRGSCNRCTMINIDQATGEREAGGEPLATLASYRRFKGKINFGILLEHEKDAAGGHPALPLDGKRRDIDVEEKALESRSHRRYVEVGQRVRVLRTSDKISRCKNVCLARPEI
ncbi:hypothetical protein R1flu_009092 [Riccia fluitans]|uniref:Molybdenum cofactor sulfurase n=1 Tax=Riccia fluitans TaxID=41844 RepID=A0ABD1Z138_9MARC